MTDRECVELLQWAAPRLRLRWDGFRRVRGQVCKRIGRRLHALGLPGVAAYRARLEADPAEWDVLDSLCRVTISRFYRDARVFDVLRDALLPTALEALRARGAPTVPTAVLSRGLVGTRGRMLVVNLPGSPRGAMESLVAIEGVLDHAVETLAGPHDHDDGQDPTA